MILPGYLLLYLLLLALLYRPSHQNNPDEGYRPRDPVPKSAATSSRNSDRVMVTTVPENHAASTGDPVTASRWLLVHPATTYQGADSIYALLSFPARQTLTSALSGTRHSAISALRSKSQPLWRQSDAIRLLSYQIIHFIIGKLFGKTR